MKDERERDDLDNTEEAEQEEQSRKGLFVGRGFYTVLAICLLAVVGVAAATFVDNRDSIPLDTAQGETTAAPTRVVSAAPSTTTAAAAAAAPTAAPMTDSAAEKTTAAQTTAAEKTSALFILPLSNDILTPFCSEPVFNETMGDYRTHTAVDFGGKENQTVRALAQGTVTDVSEDAMWGHCLTLDHGGGITSRYCGVTTALKTGDSVQVGDEIGSLSGVPCESLLAPHLHLELYKNGEAVDACALLGGQVEMDE